MKSKLKPKPKPRCRYEYCEYFDNVLPPKRLVKTLQSAVDLLRKVKFDSIAFRGMSGALFAPVLAHALNKDLLMVRKPGQSHSNLVVEGLKSCKRYIIVDDFISTGKTIEAIADEIAKFAPKAECAGIVLYANEDTRVTLTPLTDRELVERINVNKKLR